MRVEGLVTESTVKKDGDSVIAVLTIELRGQSPHYLDAFWDDEKMKFMPALNLAAAIPPGEEVVIVVDVLRNNLKEGD